ncbi:hypothetical protein IJM86_03505 [bacterium]|nr:hypothetical protein [bacterium]
MFKKKKLRYYSFIAVLVGSFFWGKYICFSHSETHFAIIPHFMIASEKVNAFYAMIKEKWYKKSDPNYVLIVSPNHFYLDEKEPQTFSSFSCFYHEKKYQLSAFP